MRPFDHLLLRGDQIFSGDGFRRRSRGTGVADVIYAFQNDEVLHSGLREHVLIETGERIDAVLGAFGCRTFMQNAVSANAHIDDGEL